MTNLNFKKTIRVGIGIVSILIVGLILWNTYKFFQRFKVEERLKMENIATAFEAFNNPDLNADMKLEEQVIESNHHIPMIVTDEDGNITIHRHLDSTKVKKEGYLESQLAIMKSQNKPLEINIPLKVGALKQYIYYKDSKILTNLKYYPLGLVLILSLFSLVVYLFIKTNRIASENKLWTGMARETAHQIGTPLTSLLGWVTLLKEDQHTQDTANEIEKDVKRLETIADRFSKIGSDTPLKAENIVAISKKSFNYLKSRSSKQITFFFESSSDDIPAKINSVLFGWVLENLVKNAIDAMQGKGEIRFQIRENLNHVILSISDTGKGISKNEFTRIFEPGFTSKKRGWGIGLSLSKRIVEDFHRGKIYVKKSEIGKGTTICVNLPKD